MRETIEEETGREPATVDAEDIEEAEDVVAAAVMVAVEGDMEVEAVDTVVVVVAVEVMGGLVEIPTETVDQSRLRKAKRLMLQSTPWADEEME